MGVLGGKTEPKADVYIHILADSIDRVVYGRSTVADWEEIVRQDLRHAFPEGGVPEPQLITPSDQQRFLTDQDLNQMVEEFEILDRQPLLEAIQFFEEILRQREARGEIWLEGMLELGVALLEAGEYDRAQDILENLVRYCESGGMLSEEMMMAA